MKTILAFSTVSLLSCVALSAEGLGSAIADEFDTDLEDDDFDLEDICAGLDEMFGAAKTPNNIQAVIERLQADLQEFGIAESAEEAEVLTAMTEQAVGDENLESFVNQLESEAAEVGLTR